MRGPQLALLGIQTGTLRLHQPCVSGDMGGCKQQGDVTESFLVWPTRTPRSQVPPVGT